MNVANAASPLHFTGQHHDEETGLEHFPARNHTAAWGRWMTPGWSASPAAVPYAGFSNPQTLDLYAYALGNPATNADPDGHWCFLGKIGTTCPPKQPAKSADPTHPDNQLSYQAAGWAANLEDTRATIAEVGTLGAAEVRAHPKLGFGALQALTLASAFFDDGASGLALPEEEALGAEAEAGGEASATAERCASCLRD